MELVTNVVRRLRAPERLFVLIHGYGADEYDLAGLVPYLDPEERFLVVCPRGPRPAPGSPGASWYDIDPVQRRMPRPEQFFESVDALDDLVDAMCAEHGLAREEAIVGGFSQGGAMTCALSFRRSQRPRPAAVLVMSSYLPAVDGLEYAWDEHDLPPVLVQHGELDPMLPVMKGRCAAMSLRANGLAVQYREYPMGHQVAMESIQDIRAWLPQALAGERPTDPTPTPVEIP